MSGGKGGSNTSSVQIPAWLEGPAKENLAKAKQASEVGYMPYYGPDVAAQNANQLLGNQATYDAAAAFGLVPQGGNANAGVPTATDYGNGIMGYSSGNLYDQAVQELADRRPGQYSMYQSMFVDPITGTVPVTFGGGTPEINQDYVSTPMATSGGNYEAPTEQNTFSPSQANNYGYIDPGSWQGLLLSAIPGGGLMMGLNNASAVGSMQDVAGIDRSGFINRATLNPNDTIGRSNIGDYAYNVNLQGGLGKGTSTAYDGTKMQGVTGLTPREANMRLNLNSQQWAKDINARVAAEQAAAAAQAAVAPAYSASPSSGSNFNTGGGSNYGNYTGGGSSWGGNPSSTISGGSGRTDGGFGW